MPPPVPIAGRRRPFLSARRLEAPKTVLPNQTQSRLLSAITLFHSRPPSDASSTPRANSTPRSSLSMPLTPRFDFPVTSSFPPWRAPSGHEEDNVLSPPTPACTVDPGPYQIFEHLRSSNIDALKAALKADTPGSSTRGLAARTREDTNQCALGVSSLKRIPFLISSYFFFFFFICIPCCRYTPLMVAVYNISGPKSGVPSTNRHSTYFPQFLPCSPCCPSSSQSWRLS
jgi:hypothetical protein